MKRQLSKAREWWLWQCPDWFIALVWSPWFERGERKYWERKHLEEGV